MDVTGFWRERYDICALTNLVMYVCALYSLDV